MGWLGWIGAALLVGVVGFTLWVRFAPSDPARWHQIPDGVEDGDRAGGAVRIVRLGDSGLARLDAVIRDTPRTKVLAGTVAGGMISYVTRSRLWGFPDYTTVLQEGDMIVIHSRLRFGASDLGVNAARIDGWLKALGQGRDAQG